ncbi:MAG: AtzG-like protein [Acidimicrobiales bacterium]
MSGAAAPGPDEREAYARAAAAAAGLTIEEAWWPAVLGHLAGLLAAAASVGEVTEGLKDEPAPVFRP